MQYSIYRYTDKSNEKKVSKSHKIFFSLHQQWTNNYPEGNPVLALSEEVEHLSKNHAVEKKQNKKRKNKKTKKTNREINYNGRKKSLMGIVPKKNHHHQFANKIQGQSSNIILFKTLK